MSRTLLVAHPADQRQPPRLGVRIEPLHVLDARSGVIVGPIFTLDGLAITSANATWRAVSWRCASPIHT